MALELIFVSARTNKRHHHQLLLTIQKEMIDIVADALGAAEEEARTKTLVFQQLEASHAYISHLEALMADEAARAGQDVDASALNVLPPATLPTSPRVGSPFLRLSGPSPYAEKLLVGGFLCAQKMSLRGPSPLPSPGKVPLQTSRCKQLVRPWLRKPRLRPRCGRTKAQTFVCRFSRWK